MKVQIKRINDAFGMEVVNGEGQTVRVDANPSIGGEGLGMRPMELLLSSMATCASIDVLLIVKKKRIALKKYEIEVRGNRVEGVPSPFESIHLVIKIDPEDPKEVIEKAMEMSLEKYCSVSASLDSSIQITFEIEQ